MMMLIHYEWPLFLSPIRAIIFYRLPQGKSRLGRDQLTSSSGDIFAALCCAMLCYAMHCKKLILYLLQTMHCLAMLWMIVG